VIFDSITDKEKTHNFRTISIFTNLLSLSASPPQLGLVYPIYLLFELAVIKN